MYDDAPWDTFEGETGLPVRGLCWTCIRPTTKNIVRVKSIHVSRFGMCVHIFLDNAMHVEINTPPIAILCQIHILRPLACHARSFVFKSDINAH